MTVRKRDGAFMLDGAARPASLRTSWTWRRGEIRIDDRVWSVHPTDPRRIGVVAQPRSGAGPTVRLQPGGSLVPAGPAQWRLGHRHGELECGSAVLRISTPRRGPVRVEVIGEWDCLELIVLTACFAIATRRRQRTLTNIAIVGATGHGPV